MRRWKHPTLNRLGKLPIALLDCAEACGQFRIGRTNAFRIADFQVAKRKQIQFFTGVALFRCCVAALLLGPYQRARVGPPRLILD